MQHPSRTRRVLPLIGLLLVLAVVYAPTLQRDVNGSSHPYMIDVGEIQVALNVWGTIHHTGYPLYTMLGALSATVFRGMGANPALSTALVSYVFGLAACWPCDRCCAWGGGG